MRKTMISLCTVLALLCCLLGSAAAAELSQPAQSASAPAAAAPEQPAAAKAAVQPQRIALLTVGRLDMAEQANLQAELQQRFYVPLNGVLGAVEFVPAADCAQALAASGCREEKDLYAQLPQLAQAIDQPGARHGLHHLPQRGEIHLPGADHRRAIDHQHHEGGNKRQEAERAEKPLHPVILAIGPP